jgi:hypothetical protein
MWPLIVIAVGGLWLLMVAGALPEAVGDLLVRAWPALLILFGFDVLLGRRRLRVSRWALYLNAVGLAITLALLVGLIWLAYDQQADVVRADRVEDFSQAIDESVTQIRLDLELGRTAVSVVPGEDSAREIKAQYKGSEESEVDLIWSVEGETGVLTVREARPDALPKLESYGRGTLDITLPVELPVQLLTLDATRGDVLLDLQPLQVNRIEIAVDHGDLVLTLPGQDVLTGKLRSEEGGIELRVPSAMALAVGLESGSGTPRYEYDRLNYVVLLEGDLQRKNADPFQISLDVWLKDGAPLTVVDLE